LAAYTDETAVKAPNTLRVLIVEDEALPAMLLQGYIEDMGHEVVGWATTAAEALQMFEERSPDLALVDLHLDDGLTGVKVAQQICRCRRPVVFVTANTRMLPDDYAGAIGVISKPYSTHGIQRALQYIEEGLRSPPPQCLRPSSLQLAPEYEHEWS
jgi:two-component system, response regulator PdtaR